MSHPFLVKTRPVCAGCGKKCGERHRHWPNTIQKPATWDGETWEWKYNPFCTLRCALAYARKAYETGRGYSARTMERAQR